VTYVSDRFFRGDESNQNPTLPSYTVVNLHSSYTVTENFEMFANVQNVLDVRHATFGPLGDPRACRSLRTHRCVAANARGHRIYWLQSVRSLSAMENA
jgi:outer membrane receptor for ferrienterochelin and colicin